ncbi:hypothetical protein ACFL5Z_10315 [Planctomycetota bacterium]
MPTIFFGVETFQVGNRRFRGTTAFNHPIRKRFDRFQLRIRRPCTDSIAAVAEVRKVCFDTVRIYISP